MRIMMNSFKNTERMLVNYSSMLKEIWREMHYGGKIASTQKLWILRLVWMTKFSFETEVLPQLQDLWNTTRYRVQTVKDSVHTVVSDAGQQRTLNRRDIKRVPSKYTSSDNYTACDVNPSLHVSLRRSLRLRDKQKSMWD